MNNPELDLENLPDGFFGYMWQDLNPRDRAKIMKGFPKTVWIFGAGASHHYNLNSRNVPIPLANGFFEAFHVLPTSEGSHAHVGPIISFLGHYRGIHPNDVSQWSENIEDFMTSIEAEINELRKIGKRRKLDSDEFSKFISLAAAFINMSFIFASVMNEAQNGPSESLYKYLLEFCGPNDTFITFNWDTLLDRALADTGGWSPNDGYGISFREVYDSIWKDAIESPLNFETNWKLLKLHGSTNWLVPYSYFHLTTLDYVTLVPDSEEMFLFWQSTLPYITYKGRWRGGYAPTCYCYYPPNLSGEGFSDEQLTTEPGRMRMVITYKGIFSPFDEPSVNGIPSSPVLITPVRQKKYDIYQAPLESIWDQAHAAMKDAEKIVIIGYSFPPTDVRPLELLKDALNSRGNEITVEIVSPSADEIVERIGDQHLSMAKKVTPHSMKFEEYLGLIVEDIPQWMKKAAKDIKEVKAWLERIYLLGEMSQKIYTQAGIRDVH